MKATHVITTIMVSIFTIHDVMVPAAAENVVFKGQVPRDFEENLEDALIKFTNTTVDKAAIKLSDIAPFSKFSVSENGKFIRVSGGNIKPGTDVSITIPTMAANGSKYNLIEWSFPTLPAKQLTKRATSTGDDLFGKVVPGGPSGSDFAGVSIPAHQFGYFYEFDRNSSFLQSPTELEILTGHAAPTSFGVLPNTWSIPSLAGDLPDNLSSGDIAVVSDHMTPDQLTGAAGVAPTSWSFSSDEMVATYAPDAFQIGDVASVLWFTSPLPGEVGGPLGLGGINATILAGGSPIFTNGTLAPIPEPSTLPLLGLGTLLLAGRVIRCDVVKVARGRISVAGLV